jgi:hypothetical protein
LENLENLLKYYITISFFQQIWVQHLAFLKLLMAKFCLFYFFVHGNPAFKLLGYVAGKNGQEWTAP